MRFDATLKELVQSFIRDYEQQLGLTDLAPLKPVNVDLSTLTAATDIVLSSGEPITTLVDLNFQAGRDARLSRRLLLYNALLHLKYGVPVHSIVVLLRPAAHFPALTGKVHFRTERGKGKMDFAFEIIRLWQYPVQQLLEGGLGTLPLAPLGKLPSVVPLKEALSPVIERIAERLAREAPSDQVAKLLTATFVLSGLRLPRDVAKELFQGVRAVKESSTYQLIVDEGRAEGRVEEARKLILKLGHIRFGAPGKKITTALHSISDLERLERLGEHLVTVASWHELLDTP